MSINTSQDLLCSTEMETLSTSNPIFYTYKSEKLEVFGGPENYEWRATKVGD